VGGASGEIGELLSKPGNPFPRFRKTYFLSKGGVVGVPPTSGAVRRAVPSTPKKKIPRKKGKARDFYLFCVEEPLVGESLEEERIRAHPSARDGGEPFQGGRRRTNSKPVNLPSVINNLRGRQRKKEKRAK